MMTMHLQLTAPAATIDAADTASRVLSGIAVPYGEAGRTSAGLLTIDAGAIRVPDQLRRVKLFREHGRTAPVGYAVSADDSPEALRMSFTLAHTPDGDQALIEAAEGVRDGLSVELDDVVIEAGHVTAARLVCVAQVPVPAYAGALLTASDTGPDPDSPSPGSGPADPEPDPEPDADDPDPEDTEDPEDPDPNQREVTTVTETTIEGAHPIGMVPSNTRRTPDPAAARRLVASHIAEAMRGATDAGQVNAALADITPASAGTADTFPRPAWIGQLWEPQAPQRRLVEAIGVSPLTAMKMQGWRWETKPEVAPYAGNKAEIPTGPATIVPAEATAQRIAGGWDLDRIYVDFNTGFVEAFMAAATIDYRKKSQTYFINGHAAVIGPPAVPAAEGIIDDAYDLGVQPDLLTGLAEVTGYLLGNGANVSFVAMASDVYKAFLGLNESEVPWWLRGQGSVTLSGAVDVAGLTIGVDLGLAPGQILGGDRDAIDLWETGPINVQAVNIPNGGIDLALFGYWAQQVHDDDGLAKASVTVVGTESAPTTTRKASK
jgi:hypothetical protein